MKRIQDKRLTPNKVPFIPSQTPTRIREGRTETLRDENDPASRPRRVYIGWWREERRH